MLGKRTRAETVAETYYDSRDADRFYERIWGGEDIHIGVYPDASCSIDKASHLSVVALADRLEGIAPTSRIFDLGAGYGGAARYLAQCFSCEVVCVNLSKVQNARNRHLNWQHGVEERVRVLHGSFENIPAADASVDIVWSQDSFLHSGRKDKVVREIARVLKPGGQVVFTDPMQADDSPAAALQAVYDRLNLDSLASPGWYRRAFTELGMEEHEWCDLTPELRTHYARVHDSLRLRYDDLLGEISVAYLNRMLSGLANWVTAADAGYLRWGIFHFRKPDAR